MDLKTMISGNIKKLRVSSEMTQTKFAVFCGLQQRAYGRIENGETMPHLEMLEKIASKHKLDIWQLLVPNFDVMNPPVLAPISEAEQEFYKNIKSTKKSAQSLPTNARVKNSNLEKYSLAELGSDNGKSTAKASRAKK